MLHLTSCFKTAWTCSKVHVSIWLFWCFWNVSKKSAFIRCWKNWGSLVLASTEREGANPKPACEREVWIVYVLFSHKRNGKVKGMEMTPQMGNQLLWAKLAGPFQQIPVSPAGITSELSQVGKLSKFLYHWKNLLAIQAWALPRNGDHAKAVISDSASNDITLALATAGLWNIFFIFPRCRTWVLLAEIPGCQSHPGMLDLAFCTPMCRTPWDFRGPLGSASSGAVL